MKPEVVTEAARALAKVVDERLLTASVVQRDVLPLILDVLVRSMMFAFISG